jgi:hypothetical protein
MKAEWLYLKQIYDFPATLLANLLQIHSDWRAPTQSPLINPFYSSCRGFMIRKMLINAEDAEESRVAIVADAVLEEFDIELDDEGAAARPGAIVRPAARAHGPKHRGAPHLRVGLGLRVLL